MSSSFLKDGTVIAGGETGQYTLLDGNKLKITTPGLLWGWKTNYFDCSLNSHSMVIKVGAVKTRFAKKQ